jgi:hypothetical protein
MQVYIIVQNSGVERRFNPGCGRNVLLGGGGMSSRGQRLGLPYGCQPQEDRAPDSRRRRVRAYLRLKNAASIHEDRFQESNFHDIFILRMVKSSEVNVRSAFFLIDTPTRVDYTPALQWE